MHLSLAVTATRNLPMEPSEREIVGRRVSQGLVAAWGARYRGRMVIDDARDVKEARCDLTVSFVLRKWLRSWSDDEWACPPNELDSTFASLACAHRSETLHLRAQPAHEWQHCMTGEIRTQNEISQHTNCTSPRCWRSSGGASRTDCSACLP